MADSKSAGVYTPAPDNVKIDERVVKKMVGEALQKVDGILDMKDGFTDILKGAGDPTRGLSVMINDDQEVSLTARIIVESGKNIPDMVSKADEAITRALQGTAGLKVKDICVEVTDTMTREEYKNREDYVGGPPVYPVM